MNDTPDQNRPAPSASSIAFRKRLRVFLILLSVAALLVGVILAVGNKSTPPQDPDSTNPSIAQVDLNKARIQTQDLQTRAMEAITGRQDTSSFIPPAEALVKKYPQFAPAHTLLAQLYTYNSQPEKALKSLQQSLKYDSQQPGVQEMAGTLALGQGLYDEAIVHFTIAVGMEPTIGRYRIMLAQSLIQAARFEDARMTLLQALQMNSDQHEAYYALSTLDAKQGDLQQAITQAKRAIDRLPEDKSGPRQAYVRWLAKLLMRDNRPAESLQAMEQLEPKDLQSPPVLEDMAVAWQMLGKPGQGAALYEAALAANPDQWPLALGAARWYLKAKDKPNAKRMADALARINPTAPALEELYEQLK